MSQNFSFLAVTALEKLCFEDLEEKGDLSELNNDQRVCRTAPATVGLLNTVVSKCRFLNKAHLNYFCHKPQQKQIPAVQVLCCGSLGVNKVLNRALYGPGVVVFIK